MAWFYISKSLMGKQLKLDSVEDILQYKDGFLTCKKIKENWGLASLLNGKITWKISPRYVDVGVFSEGLLPCKVEDKWGFVDENNKMILPFIWDYVYSFSSGLAVVAQNEKWGLINKSGEWLVSASTDYLRSFSDGFAVGRIRNTWFVIDSKGKSVLSPQVNYLGSFYQGLAAVNMGGKLIQSKLVMGGNWGFIDIQGKIVIPTKYTWVGNFLDDYAPYFIEQNNEWGLLSKQGIETPFARVTGIREFSEGFASVEKKGLWGFYNAHGEEIVPCLYKDIKPFNHGQAFIQKED